MKTFLNILKKIALLFLGVSFWFWFSYITLYREKWALDITGGNPLPSEASYLLFPIIVSLIFFEGYYKKGVAGFLFKAFMLVLFLIAILFTATTIISKP